jgi:aryl-alcohol dehydrogenase
VLGHEGAGIVEQVGPAVKAIQVGDHVVMSATCCTHCVQCRCGYVAYCENLFAEDFGGRRTRDGTTSLSTAQDEQVSSHFFGQSSFATHANVVGSGSSVAVSGSAAVGLAAIMAAKIAGATTIIAIATTIIAIAMHESRLELAKGLGAAKPGTEAPFEVGASLARGWKFKTIVQGSSVPQEFIPHLVAFWRQGKFRLEKLSKNYVLEDINLAFADSASGVTIKPVILFA